MHKFYMKFHKESSIHLKFNSNNQKIKLLQVRCKKNLDQMPESYQNPSRNPFYTTFVHELRNP